MVVAGANVIVAAYYRALALDEKHKITALTASLLAKTLSTVHTAAQFSGLTKTPTPAIATN